MPETIRAAPVTMHALTRLDSRLELPLLTLFASQGVADRYWSRLKPAFSPGPALLCLAVAGPWRASRLAPDSVRGAMYAVPFNHETAELSMPVIDPRYKSDPGLLAALWKTALDRLASLRMRRLRYGLHASSRFLANWLRRTGTATIHASSQAGVVLESEIAPLAETLRLADLTVDELLSPMFGELPQHDDLAHYAIMMRLLGNSLPTARLADARSSR